MLSADTGVVAPSDWTRDGQHIIWKRQGGDATSNDVMMASLREPGTVRPLAATGTEENTAKVWPDGKWLAFESNESGQSEVYIQAFPEAGQRWQVSRGGGQFPRWRSDGRELFFYTGRALAAAEVVPGAPPRLGRVSMLFPFNARIATVNDYPYAASPDGTRFLVNELVPASPMLNVLVNWQSTLERPR